MTTNIKQKIENYLEKGKFIRLGTISEKGVPVVHTVAYVSEGADVYFVSERDKRKVQNILLNRHASYAADTDYENWGEIKGVQMIGKGVVLTDTKDIEKAKKMLAGKYPPLGNLPPDHDWAYVKITPVEAYFLDNTVRFGHRDRVEY